MDAARMSRVQYADADGSADGSHWSGRVIPNSASCSALKSPQWIPLSPVSRKDLGAVGAWLSTGLDEWTCLVEPVDVSNAKSTTHSVVKRDRSILLDDYEVVEIGHTEHIARRIFGRRGTLLLLPPRQRMRT
jgi:hypothetical protein